MKSLIEYIYENSNETYSNKDRLKKLKSWLKSKNYHDYINTLNKMLEDPKAASLLQDGFGGSLGNMKLKYSIKEIPAKNLIPSQSEIDIDKSLKHCLTNPNNIDNDFNEPIVLANMPLITFNGKYIIDGHHRWSEPAIINPNGKMLCFNYDGHLTPIEMLKAVQGAIASVMADDNDNNEKLPSSHVEGKNIYDMSDKEISNYIKKYLTKEVSDKIRTLTQSNNVERYILDNIKRFQQDNKPPKGMPNRGDMPQTNKAGTEKGNKITSMPEYPGSALNKLKQKKINKDVVK